MISTYLYAVDHLEINSIRHKYLVRGHTQNEGDAIHSIIEKSVKKIKKSGPIYVPDQYISAIRYAKKNGKPLQVKEMNFDDFLDLKFLHDEMALTSTKNTHGGDFKISEVKLLQIEKGNPFLDTKQVTSKKNEIVQSSGLKNGALLHYNRLKEIHRKPAYTKKIPVADNKKKGSKSLLDGKLIPGFYKPFFESIF